VGDEADCYEESGMNVKTIKTAHKRMVADWNAWHIGVPADARPEPNISFEKGFNACLSWLWPLLTDAAAHVEATNEAEHMTDGFGPKRARASDRLLERLREAGL
jgi:hypothetical protein